MNNYYQDYSRQVALEEIERRKAAPMTQEQLAAQIEILEYVKQRSNGDDISAKEMRLTISRTVGMLRSKLNRLGVKP